MTNIKRLFGPVLTAIALFAVSCSGKGDEPTPVDPVETPISLTQLEVSLDELSVLPNTRAANAEEAHVIKTAFNGGDYFQLVYTSPDAETRTVYAHTKDGAAWSFHQTADVTSGVQNVYLASVGVGLKAAYLPSSAKGAAEGIVLGIDNTLTCYDALQASGNAVIAGQNASAKLSFTHVNHLLRFTIDGDVTPADVAHLLLTLTYKDAQGRTVEATLTTSLQAEYTDAAGAKQTVLQAIVPREAVLTGTTLALKTGEILASPTSLACPGGKSRIVAFHLSNKKVTVQPGDITAGWIDGGMLNSSQRPSGDIYIGNVEQLKAFRDAVNTPNGTIDGVTAHTAHVIQTADIDLGNEEWIPIGGADGGNTFFAGTYNGNGYKISNLKITSYDKDLCAGFFGRVKSYIGESAVLTGIHLRNVQIVGTNQTSYAGALIGLIPNDNAPVVVSLCSASGSVSLTTTNDTEVEAGGLIGSGIGVHVTRCTTHVDIITKESKANTKVCAGGIIGNSTKTIIASCYAKGKVDTQQATTVCSGGIVGQLSDNTSLVMACRADGAVTATGTEGAVGGLVGATNGIISGNLAKGEVTFNTTNGRVGAIIGDNLGTVVLSYGVGAVGVGTSHNAVAEADNVVYQTNPSAEEVFSIVTGSAWAAANNKQNHVNATYGGILTPVSTLSGGHYSGTVQPRMWVLFDVNSPWKNASADGYPVPVMTYMGQ